MRTRCIALALVSASLLAACGNEADDVSVDEGGSVEGEVLGGSISDDMIALDQLQSQSPPLEDQPAAPASGNNDAAPASEESSPQADTVATEAASEPSADDEG